MPQEMKKERDYLFDNYKALLILLVVASHFMEPSYRHQPLLYEMKWMINAFHMPAFLFISGYFSKKDPSWVKMLKTLAIPYLVFEVFYFVLYKYILGMRTSLSLERPKFSLWFLMALFVYKAAVPVLRRIPAIITLPLSIAGGLLIGLTNLEDFLSIPRIVFFLPFFLAGMYFKPEWVKAMRNRVTMVLSSLVLAGSFIFLFFEEKHRLMKVTIFYGRYSYEALKQTFAQGVQVRIVCYVIAFALVFLWLMALPGRECSFSYVGRCTMSVYLFHGLILKYIQNRSEVLTSVKSYGQAALLLLFCVFLVWQLSQPAFVRVVDVISGNWKLPTLCKKVPEQVNQKASKLENQ